MYSNESLFKYFQEFKQVCFSTNSIVKIVNFCGKLLLANIIAVLVISFFAPLFYTPNTPSFSLYGLPFPHRKPGDVICKAIHEGYIGGVLDSNGFNNLYCVERDVPPLPGLAKRNLSLLFGDSHMEAYHVPMDKNCCYLVNKELGESDQDFLLYSIAFNALKLPDIAKQIDAAIDYFQPQQSIVVEIKKFPDPAEAKKIVLTENDGRIQPETLCAKLEKNRLVRFVSERTSILRAILYNIERVMWRKKDAAKEIEIREEWNDENVVYLRELLKKLSETSLSRGIQPIIFYHNRFTLNADGSATLNEDPKIVELFRTECEKQGIVFLYLGNRFIREYEENNILPYGFWNTLPNFGHLNKDGHRMVADELCKVFKQIEETKKESLK